MTYAFDALRVTPHRVLHVLFLAAQILVPARLAGQERTWPVHSMERPRPPLVTTGTPVSTPPPSDAIVLFDGRGLAEWRQADGTPPRWKVADGSMEVLPGSGSLATRREFGDIQLHVEWRAPTPPHGDGQERGNSGVYLMGRYEVQVLDSWQNDTYPDGQAAALYGQHPPLVNASRPPGEWQSYDIIFHRPHFNADGSVASPARATVFHNGVMVQDETPFTGSTVHGRAATYQAHGDRGPVMLQDHETAIRFRNIWVRELSY